MLTVNQKSWHYQLADFAGLAVYRGRTYICSYLRKVALGILLMLVVIALACALIVVFVMLPMFQILTWVFHDIWVHAMPGAVVIYLTSAIAGPIAVFYGAKHWLSKAVKRETVVAAAYRGWKEKTCVLVEIKDGK